MRTLLIFTLLLTVLAPVVYSQNPYMIQNNEVLILCYHDIPKEVNLDKYAVDQRSFIQQIEYLRAQGYTFVSVEDIIQAHQGNVKLPEKAVLLSFDDAYLSFYEFVYPLLKLYEYPSMLAVVSDWIDIPPEYAKAPLMSWEQLKDITQSDLIEIASHSNNLHRAVQYTPQGNTSAAAACRIYDARSHTYENEKKYRQRIRQDLQQAKNILKNKLGIKVRAIVWPYGQYTQLGIEEAKRLGFEAMFALQDKLTHVNDINSMTRYIIINNPSMEEFIEFVHPKKIKPQHKRIVQADLDLIYDPDPVQQEENLDAFIERIFQMKASTVFLQAFADPEGNGDIKEVYFPNRVLPTRADIFDRVVNQLSIREIEVYAWMPMLSIVLPDRQENDQLRVREWRDGKIQISTSWYKRLSPFSTKTHEKLKMLYEDLAVHCPRLNGIVFQDDGYLNDFEDFHPEGLKMYAKITGDETIPYQELSDSKKEQWTRFKTKTLIALTEELKKVVLKYLPYAQFVRTFYAPILTDPESEEWFAQNYADSLKAYDYVMIMAYPKMEEVRNDSQWLRSLVRTAKQYGRGIEKTIFKVQAYDWREDAWIDSKQLHQWMRQLVSSGAQHIGYYPDDYTINEPDSNVIRLMMSVEDFPFKRK